MKKYNLPRRAWKTTRLIFESSKTWARIICPNNQMCNVVKKLANWYKLDIKEPISIHEAIRTKRYDREEVLIDEGALCLQSLLYKNFIKTISL